MRIAKRKYAKPCTWNTETTVIHMRVKQVGHNPHVYIIYVYCIVVV